METILQTLVALIVAGDIDKARDKFSNKIDAVEKAIEQWDVKKHEVMSRVDKQIKGKTVKQWKLPIPYQKKIVQTAVAFLFGKPVRLVQVSTGTDEAFKILTDLFDDMRMHARDRKNARHVFSQTESAKLFVPYRDSEADKSDLTKFNSAKCILLAKSLGDDLYTLLDEYGVMQAIGRGYYVEVSGIKIEHFDIYTAEKIYYCDQDGTKWNVVPKPNVLGKIPITYYSQEQTEWADVQAIIERLEMLTSRRADTNDYTADPILVLMGDVESMPDKEDTGKTVQLNGQGANAFYLSPQMAIEMVKEEKESLKELIHYCTDTPDLSMDKMATIGTTSGKAIELFFFAAILKAMDKQEIFHEMIDREINICKAMISKVIDMKIADQVKRLEVAIEFGNPLPDNIADIIDMLSTATGGKASMSQQTAIGLNPLVKDSAAEESLVKAENISAIVE